VSGSSRGAGGAGNGAGLDFGAEELGKADEAAGGRATVRVVIVDAGGVAQAHEGTEDPDGVEEAVVLGARQPPNANQAGATSSANRTTRAITPACEGCRAERSPRALPMKPRLASPAHAGAEYGGQATLLPGKRPRLFKQVQRPLQKRLRWKVVSGGGNGELRITYNR
jgi:hypothetical protein